MKIPIYVNSFRISRFGIDNDMFSRRYQEATGKLVGKPRQLGFPSRRITPYMETCRGNSCGDQNQMHPMFAHIRSNKPPLQFRQSSAYHVRLD